MFKLVIVCNGKELCFVDENMEEVHEDCAMIERMAHKLHCLITVKCYEDSTRIFDRFFG